MSETEDERPVAYASLSKRERIRFFRDNMDMPPFLAKNFVDFIERMSGNAEEVPPYSLTMLWDPDDRIFVVTVPELPGCRTHGATYEEAAANAREAIASWIGAARDLGEALPAPRVERHLLGDDETLTQAVG
jgi:predicted RNase H-like HicB family nuclease